MYKKSTITLLLEALAQNPLDVTTRFALSDAYAEKNKHSLSAFHKRIGKIIQKGYESYFYITPTTILRKNWLNS